MNRTPEQIAAVETMAKTLCVDAGAGSGKTRVLIDRIIHLIATQRATLDEIAAITFTDKAAAEMKVRLRKAFREKAPRDEPGEMSRWREMERRIETARISTIHGFCGRLLREHALRIGMDPDFTVLAESEALLLRNETVTNAIHDALERGIEPIVRAATELGPSRLISLLESLLNRRGPMERVRAEYADMTPETLASHWRRIVEEERQQRLLRLATDPTLRRIRNDLAAFDGYCSNPNDGRETGRREMIALLDRIFDSRDARVISEAIGGIAGIKFRPVQKKNWDSSAACDQVIALEEELRKLAKKQLSKDPDDAVESRAAQLTLDVLRAFEVVADAFAAAKTARTSLDFDDLIYGAAAMLRDHADVRARTARGIKFLLIDEFQDTDSSQLEIARLLAADPHGPDVFIVGDAKQSIYDFRGAEVEVFQDEKAGASAVIPLSVNFRTVPEVLAFVNDFFSQSGLLQAVEPEYRNMDTHRDPAGECRVEFLVPPKREKAGVDEYRRDEAEVIASRIAGLCRGERRVQVFDPDENKLRPAEFGDVAILFRSTSSVYLYEQALRKREIPYHVVAGAGFYERQEILDIRNLLSLLVDPCDKVAEAAFWRGPLGGLSDDSLMMFFWCFRTLHPKDFPKELDQGQEMLRVASFLRDLRAHREMPLPDFLHYVLVRTGYEAIALSQFLGEQKAHNVRKILDLAEDFARTRPARLPAFLQYLDEIAGHEAIREGDALLQPEEAGAVTLMTIHKAKGLEFPIVVIPDLSRARRRPEAREVVVHRRLGIAACVTGQNGDSIKPAIYESIQAEHEAKGDAEHARILYVAMTRARDRLLLGGAPEPGSGSWLKTLDSVYGVVERADGDRLGADGWNAVVRRAATAKSQARADEPRERPVADEKLDARIQPIANARVARRVFSVSELLDRMTGTSDPDEPHEAHETSELAARFGRMRGTLLHRLFELWNFEGDPPLDELLPRECPAVGMRERMRPYLQDAARRFQESAIGQRIRADRDCRKEIPFLLRVNDALVSGTIDALLSDGILVDYKTGARKDDSEARYLWQLRIYALAVQALLKKCPPVAVIYYVDSGEHRMERITGTCLAETRAKLTEVIAAMSGPLTPA